MAALGLEENALRLAVAGAASGGTDVNGAAFDMAGYDGVYIFCTIATFNAGNFLKAQQGEQANLSDAADLAGSKLAAVANGQVVCLDVNRPRERYVRGVVVRGGANTATGDMYYVGYKASQQPVLNLITNVLLSKQLASPTEGTP